MSEINLANTTRRKRFLVYSHAGVGKTYNYLKLAESLYASKTDSHFYIIDPDDGFMETFDEFDKKICSVIHYYKCKSFLDVIDAFKEILSKLRTQDYLVIEQVGQIWELAQQYYVKEIFQDDIGNYYLEMRKRQQEARKSNQVVNLDGWQDWSIIKRLHNMDFMEIATKSTDSNVILTSSADNMDIKMIRQMNPTDQKLFSTYATVNYVKPEGEKHNAYRVDVILYLYKTSDGKRYMSVVKNRGGPEVADILVDKDTNIFDIYNRIHKSSKSKTQDKSVSRGVSVWTTE